MSQVEKKKSNIINVWVIIILIGSLGLSVSLSINLKTSKNKIIEKYKTLNITHSKTLSLISKKTDEIKRLKKDLSKITERLNGIKDSDDLLKRDIFLYISEKFQRIPKTTAKEISDQIVKTSKIQNISPELIVGIIQVESSFNSMAISKKNARGLMQVMPEWAKKFNLKYVNDLHDIDTNIKCGVEVLKIHIKESKGSITKGLYYYVGKSDSYSSKVYEAVGKFVSFRSIVDDDESSQLK